MLKKTDGNTKDICFPFKIWLSKKEWWLLILQDIPTPVELEMVYLVYLAGGHFWITLL